jgi:alanine dehydrogenase
MMRVLSAGDVRSGLPMSEAVEAMREAFRALSEGRSTVPPRTHIPLSDPPGDALFMPSCMPSIGRIGVKAITLFGGNPARGLPMLQAVMLMLDAETGAPLALIDGNVLTAIRTGAASGAATDALARRDASVAAIFGAGLQARTQLEAVCSVRPVRDARVYDVRPEPARSFAADMSTLLGIRVLPAETPTEALAGADIVCTATTSREPVFDDADLEGGTHINAVGSYKPDVRELPGQTVARAVVVVDRISDAMAEAGDLVVPLTEGLFGADHIATELGDVLAGRAPGRESAEQITLFKSVGVAVQDLAAADRLLRRAERDGLGVEVSL